MKQKIFGVCIIAFALIGGFFVFYGRIKSHDTQTWNAAPFIFAIAFLVVWGISKFEKS